MIENEFNSLLGVNIFFHVTHIDSPSYNELIFKAGFCNIFFDYFISFADNFL